jgi:glycosyltransferase involved in cell wall biosynthesis
VITCVVTENPADLQTSFVQTHVKHLPGQVIAIAGFLPHEGSRPVLSQAVQARLARKMRRIVTGKGWDDEITRSYAAVFRRASVVLAEFGPTGVRVLPACMLTRVPLVVHFHGYDASVSDVLQQFSQRYKFMFSRAAAVISVSRKMHERLLSLGAPPERTFYIPYGIDCERFVPLEAAGHDPGVILTAGRFVDKKAPHLTILSFANVVNQQPFARLRMIGDGPLLGACRDLVRALRIEHAVEFIGSQPHDTIRMEMQRASVFAQHSVEAANGDSEGTPLAILEACATGLPVVATNHAGIADSVIHAETGFLVEERDIDGMAQAMLALLRDPALARRFGAAARRRILGAFSQPEQIKKLSLVLEDAAGLSSVAQYPDR